MGKKSIGIGILIVTGGFWFLGSDTNPHALTKSRVVDTIIGEAEAEPYKGKLAVACAIRERGNLKGCNGWKSERVRGHKYSPKVFVDAVRAYEESRDKNKCMFVNGADSWWTRSKMFNCPRIAKVGRHYFFNCQ